jgi:hypothetical protein
MTGAILAVIMFLALILWRFVFAVLHRRPLLREIAAPHRHYDNALEQRFLILERACAGVIAENGFDAVLDGVCLFDGRSRAKTYLCRVAALTGATQTDHRCYVLDVGKTRFYVRDRYVRRLQDSTNPECGYEQTCCYPVHKGMPREEEIATVLLQLKNNPALFDKWAVQNGLAFKSDGQVFTRAQ